MTPIRSIPTPSMALAPSMALGPSFALSLSFALALASCGNAPVPSAPEGPEAAAVDGAVAQEQSDALDGSFTFTDAAGFESPLARAFLIDRDGLPVLVTARSRVDPSPTDGQPLPLELWEDRVDASRAHFGPATLALGGPACAGLDHWSSDVLMLTVDALPDDLAPAAASRRVPAPGETVSLSTGTAAVLEVFSDGFLELAPNGSVRTPEAGTPVLDGDGAVLAVVSATEGRGPARRVSAQLLLPFLNTPKRLQGRSAGTVGPPLVHADLSADGRLLVAGTPPLSRVVVVDLDARRPYAPLAPIDEARRFGLGGFPDEGFSFVAAGDGRTELFETGSGIPLAAVDAPEGPPRELATAGSVLAITSATELVVIDLDAFEVRRRLPGPFGPVGVDGDRVLVGAGNRVLAVAAEGNVPPRVVVELGDGPDGRPRLATALAVDGATLWIGSDSALLSAPNDGARHAARERLATGQGAVNVIRPDGDRLWIATGALVEDEAGDLVSADCYVRVLDARDGRELARSHDHASAVRALFETADGWLGLAGDGSGFRWSAPPAERLRSPSAR